MSAQPVPFSNFKNAVAVKNNIKILMISGSNFIFNNTGQETLKKQVASIPFIVSFSSFVDETSSFAHLIIPDHNDLVRHGRIIIDAGAVGCDLAFNRVPV